MEVCDEQMPITKQFERIQVPCHTQQPGITELVHIVEWSGTIINCTELYGVGEPTVSGKRENSFYNNSSIMLWSQATLELFVSGWYPA